jgi:hypothetical protein
MIMHTTSSLSATSTAPSAIATAIFFILYFIFIVVMVTALWKIFKKAGRPGWAAIIPFYNTYILIDIVGRPVWWLFLLFIPLVNLVVIALLYFDLAKSFGRSSGFGLGLIFLAPIFIPILGFGSSTYVGPSASGGVAPLAEPTYQPPAATPPTL